MTSEAETRITLTPAWQTKSTNFSYLAVDGSIIGFEVACFPRSFSKSSSVHYRLETTFTNPVDLLSKLKELGLGKAELSREWYGDRWDLLFDDLEDLLEVYDSIALVH